VQTLRVLVISGDVEENRSHAKPVLGIGDAPRHSYGLERLQIRADIRVKIFLVISSHGLIGKFPSVFDINVNVAVAFAREVTLYRLTLATMKRSIKII